MNKNTAALFKLFILTNLFILALMSMPEQNSADKSSVIWKHQASGEITTVAANVRADVGGAVPAHLRRGPGTDLENGKQRLPVR